jgi:hypothetical protein
MERCHSSHLSRWMRTSTWSCSLNGHRSCCWPGTSSGHPPSPCRGQSVHLVNQTKHAWVILYIWSTNLTMQGSFCTFGQQASPCKRPDCIFGQPLSSWTSLCIWRYPTKPFRFRLYMFATVPISRTSAYAQMGFMVYF